MRQAKASEQLRVWKPGDAVPTSGIYAVVHWEQQLRTVEAMFIANECFPRCKDCGDNVRFQLLRSIPYIFEDEDFRRLT